MNPNDINDIAEECEPQYEDSSLTRSSARLSRNEELEEVIMALEAEKTRIESQAMENDHFFTGMVHEIQPHLASVLSMLDLMITGQAEQNASDIARDVQATVRQVMTVVNDVLDLSRMKTGDLVLVEKHYDFPRMLKNIRSTSYFQSKEKGLRFLFHLDPALPQCVVGDEERLRQILLNIVGNAIKYTVRGQVSMSVTLDGDFVRFDVADTGIGMDAENAEALFNPFHNTLNTARGVKKGTGLGLAISKRLVEMMGGSIMLDSVPGSGSRFHLRLPVKAGDPSMLEPMEAKPGPSLPVILVVDDKESNLHHAAKALENMGYACETALSGQEALEMAQKRTYSLILMDYAMPVMDGAATAFAIRCVERTRVPIIGLVSTQEMKDTRKFFNAGMDDVLAKPVDGAQLRRTLSKWATAPERPSPENTFAGEASVAGGASMGGPRFGIVEMAGNIEGLDVDMGLAMVAGQHGMYEDLLHLAAETLPDLVDKLIQAVKQSDTERMRIEINGLEGSLYTLGAITLSEQAKTCEAALETGGLESCETKMRDFLRGMQIFVNQLQALFENSPSTSTVLFGDNAILAGRLNKTLREMALGNHVQVRRLMTLVTKRDYEDVPRSVLMEIKLLVNSGEYGVARGRIETVIRGLPQ